MRSTVRIFVVSCSVLVGAVALSAAQGQQPAPPAGAPAGAPGGAGGPGGGRQAGPPPTPQNLKVLPKTWTLGQVQQLMQTFVESLGQNPPNGEGCAFCHSADPNAPAPTDGRPARLVYALDVKKEKDVARKMIQMVMAINSESLKDVGDAAVPEKVTCFTCHNGNKVPMTTPAAGWGRGSFTLLPAGPVVPARGPGGPGGGGPGGPGGGPAGPGPGGPGAPGGGRAGGGN